MRSLLPLLCATTSPLAALNIQIDYTYDSNNFFDTQEKRDAIEAVAQFYGDLLQDNLLSIDSSEFSATSTWVPTVRDPATGVTLILEDFVVPEDTVIVYVGSRDLGGNVRGRGGPNGFTTGTRGSSAWIDRLLGRGQPGAEFRSEEANLRTDIGLWGGVITFDDDSDWNFSLDQNQPGVEFLGIALHEMGHVLGLGPSDPWDNLVVDGVFTGPAATASNGSSPPADGGHFLESLNSPLYGSFGASHGSSRPVLMLASSTDDGNNFDVITDLDLAALVDIGWEVVVPTPFDSPFLSPSGASFSWPSSSFCSYQVRQSSDLDDFSGGSALFAGDGSIQSWTDPSPEALRSFYLLEVTSTAVLAKAPPALKRRSKSTDSGKIETAVLEPREVTNCTCEHYVED